MQGQSAPLGWKFVSFSSQEKTSELKKLTGKSSGKEEGKSSGQEEGRRTKKMRKQASLDLGEASKAVEAVGMADGMGEGKKEGNCLFAPTCFDKKTSEEYENWETYMWTIDPEFSDCDSPAYAGSHTLMEDLRHCKEPALDSAGQPLSVQDGVPICKSCFGRCGHFLEKVHYLGGRCWGGERAFHMYPGGSIRSTMDQCQAQCYRTAQDGQDSWSIAHAKDNDGVRLSREGRVTAGQTQSFTCTRHCTPTYRSLMDPLDYTVNYVGADNTTIVYCDFHKVVQCWPKASGSVPGGSTASSDATGIDCSQEKRLSCATLCASSHELPDTCNQTACLDHPNICETMTTYM